MDGHSVTRENQPTQAIGATPMDGQIRYIRQGGIQVHGSEIVVPGVVVAQITNGEVEQVPLAPGRWRPVLVAGGHRYRLDDLIISGDGPPSTSANPGGSYLLTLTGKDVVYVEDGTYEVRGHDV